MFPSTYETLLIKGIQSIENWEKQWPAYGRDETLEIQPPRLYELFNDYVQKMKDNYPHFHPLYAGQMIKPPHPIAVVGYLIAMLVNPNNHALDSSPATSRMEKEVIQLLGKRFGFLTPLGHLTGGGTVANMEALWVSQQLHPDKLIVFCDEAHYTHSRVCDILGAPYVKIPATPQGQLDLEHLKPLLEAGKVGTVVATLGSTALGALDPLHALVALKAQYGFRIHVDTAYGGFYSVLSQTDEAFSEFNAIQDCDSVVIDPHKHGLQPYGCGCVIFADPDVGRLYLHDSPYTYFTSDDLHLGEISLECSRSGAAAAAFWLTLQYFPLEAEAGFGPILKKTRQAALGLSEYLESSAQYSLYLPPQLDIVTYFPTANTTHEISRKSEAIFRSGMTSQESPLFLAKLKVPAENFIRLHPHIQADSDSVVLFRSCLLKPEHETQLPQLIAALEHHAATASADASTR